MLCVFLCTLCHKKGTPYANWRNFIVRNYGIHVISPCVTVSAGILPWTYRIEYDYSKWLGPNYKYRYDGAGINVVNHVSLMDVVAHQGMIRPFTSFLGKEEAKSIPGLGPLCEFLDQMLVTRDKKLSAEESSKFIDDIGKRAI